MSHRNPVLLAVLAMMGCTAAAELPVEQAPPANAFPLNVSTEVFVSNWVWSGRQVFLAVNSINGPEQVFFGYTTTPGAASGPCPPALQGECLDIGGPGLTLAGSEIADGNGIAFFDFTLPNLPVGDIAFQAAYSDGAQGFTSNRIDLPILSDRDDLDGDGGPDFIELQFGTDPTNPDTDGDGLEDAEEVLTYGTNPIDADTDRGGVPDGDEVAAGTDPLDRNDDTTGILDIDSIQPGALVITEVMQNPDVVPDSGGEWFEIQNVSNDLIDLDGLRVSDAGSNAFSVTGSVVVPAGAYVVFATSDDTNINGIVFPDYVYGTAMTLSNGGDEIVLSNRSGVIDAIAWDGGPVWPAPTGATTSLNPSATDATSNDDGANWCAATTPFGDGDRGTPGAPNPDCGTPPPPMGVDSLLPGDLVITEFLQNPVASADGDAEWFEVYNASGGAVDLMGLVVSDAGSESFVVNTSVSVAAGGYALFGINDNTFVNGGLNHDFVYSGFNLSNSDDEIILSNAGGAIDAVFYDGGPTFPDPDGASTALSPSALDATANDDGSNWCVGTSVFGGGDAASPGAANPACP
jgi:hypothetical protein